VIASLLSYSRYVLAIRQPKGITETRILSELGYMPKLLQNAGFSWN